MHRFLIGKLAANASRICIAHARPATTALARRHFAAATLALAKPAGKSAPLPPPKYNDTELPDRTWIDNFSINDIPETAYTTSYARASGPGGQNVNKVNTKVIMRVHDFSFMPPYCEAKLRALQANSINKNDELIIASDRFRIQRGNLDDCVQKLYEMVVEAGYVPRETSQSQRRRVGKLIEGENERRLEAKKHSGKKKAERRGGKGDWSW
ncbi:hypothetical protein H9P43_009971 [Blastocladiella emersonii ATCC 22665]|nr:hypothetical protein H9P43_009971 [Blastocladiella emersonii ATCC 22665]